MNPRPGIGYKLRQMGIATAARITNRVYLKRPKCLDYGKAMPWGFTSRFCPKCLSL